MGVTEYVKGSNGNGKGVFGTDERRWMPNNIVPPKVTPALGEKDEINVDWLLVEVDFVVPLSLLLVLVLVREKGDPVVVGVQVRVDVFAGPPGGSAYSARDWARSLELLPSTPLLLLLLPVVVVVVVEVVEGEGPG